MQDIIKHLKAKFKADYLKFGNPQLDTQYQKAAWIKNNLPPALSKNKNAIVMAYWCVFNEIKGVEDVPQAEQVETILRSLRS